jgi:hypothetical protein
MGLTLADFSKVKKFGRAKNNRSLDVEFVCRRAGTSAGTAEPSCAGACTAGDMIAGASAGEAGWVCAAPAQAPIQRRLLHAKDFENPGVQFIRGFSAASRFRSRFLRRQKYSRALFLNNPAVL